MKPIPLLFAPLLALAPAAPQAQTADPGPASSGEVTLSFAAAPADTKDNLPVDTAGGAFSSDGRVTRAVRVTESEGLVVPVDRDAASILVANPDIANVQPLSDRSLFLFGKAVGATMVFVLDADDEIILERRVVVTRSLRMLEASTRNVLPPVAE